MNLVKKFLFFFLILGFSKNSIAIEIKNLATINNHSITNFDLFEEIKNRSVLENKKTDQYKNIIILQELIREKIKEIEVVSNDIKVSKNSVETQVNLFLKKRYDEKKSGDEIKEYLFKKIENSMKWNALITSIYRKKISINMNEIDEIIKTNKELENKKKNIIRSEEEKKLNIFSKTHYNKVRKKYFVKKYL